MFKQPGFLVLSVYAAWIYAQYTLVLMVRDRVSRKEQANFYSFWERSHQSIIDIRPFLLAFVPWLPLSELYLLPPSRKHHTSAVHEVHLLEPTVSP